MRENAYSPQQDKKTLWSFTVACHCVRVFPSHDRGGDVEVVLLGITEPMVKYHPWCVSHLTLTLESGQGTVLGGQFDWGGLLQKCNGGVQRYPQRGWQSRKERKGIVTGKQIGRAHV